MAMNEDFLSCNRLLRRVSGSRNYRVLILLSDDTFIASMTSVFYTVYLECAELRFGLSNPWKALVTQETGS